MLRRGFILRVVDSNANGSQIEMRSVCRIKRRDGFRDGMRLGDWNRRPGSGGGWGRPDPQREFHRRLRGALGGLGTDGVRRFGRRRFERGASEFAEGAPGCGILDGQRRETGFPDPLGALVGWLGSGNDGPRGGYHADPYRRIHVFLCGLRGSARPSSGMAVNWEWGTGNP